MPAAEAWVARGTDFPDALAAAPVAAAAGDPVLLTRPTALPAVVTSALPLTEKEKEELAAVFEARLGKKLRVTNVVDSDLLGGLIVRVGDRLYDGSLRTKLIRFRQKLTGTQVG